MDEYYLYTFESTHGAIASHKLLKGEMEAIIMPVLREISASCGMAVKVLPDDLGKSLEMMKGQDEIEFSLYHIKGEDIEQVKL